MYSSVTSWTQNSGTMSSEFCISWYQPPTFFRSTQGDGLGSLQCSATFFLASSTVVQVLSWRTTA